jgi:pimeloyl-ACP methyl ester carboxylesterase
MRKFVWLLLCLTALQLQAQDISGKWYGALKIGGSTLRLTLDLSKSDSGYAGRMISMDQGNASLPLQSVSLNGNTVDLKSSVGGIAYTGTTEDSLIRGTFTQNGQKFPLEFGRTPIEKLALRRPQEPKEPYPYSAEDVTFFNARDSITLAGTLTFPAGGGKFPVVILISGSGPQNRNEELVGHKPFLVLADHLTRNGIAVLRYDDRGVGMSKGNFNKATTADFANDVDAAVAYLKTRKETDLKKIGLIGHSEGGIIAPMVAARNRDVGYIVLMAGPGVNGKDVLELQVELMSKAAGAGEADAKKEAKQIREITDILTMNGDSSVISSAFWAYINNAYANLPDSTRKQVSRPQFAMQYARLNTPWMKYFLSYDPATALEKIKIPVLALNGSKDLQVWAPQNLPAIEKALKKAGNKKYVIRELPGLNHLFQECKTGGSDEYGEIEQTLSPVLLGEITAFIKKSAN